MSQTDSIVKRLDKMVGSVVTLEAHVSDLRDERKVDREEHKELFKSIAGLTAQHNAEATAIKESLKRIEHGVNGQNGNSKRKTQAMVGGGAVGVTGILYLLVDRVVQAL